METIGRHRFTLKQIFQDNWDPYLAVYKHLVTFYIAYNVWKIMSCREPDGLGYVTFACPDHPGEVCHIPRSCKSRFCSVCAKVQIDNWVSDMNRLFPNCPYYHVTFTVPSQFRTLLFEKRALLNAVFSASAETLISFCKERGFLPAITAVLHTFGSDLKRHVHVHIIVSAGGLKLNGKQERYTRFAKRKAKDPRAKMEKVSVLVDNPGWVSFSKFPFKVLHKRYQVLLIKHLKERILQDVLSDDPDPDLLIFSNPAVMTAFFDSLLAEYRRGFYVNISKERIDLEQTSKYLARYTRRPPLSEVRIKNYTGDMVTFEFKDYRNHGSKVLNTVQTFEFIRRLTRHIPPHYFNVIRHYGILASRVKSAYKALTDKLLNTPPATEQAPDWRARQTAHRGQDPLVCRICQKVMRLVSIHLPNPLRRIKMRLQAAFP